jgi:uncharacterized protein YhjY with autotransporter beta-barrel domain
MKNFQNRLQQNRLLLPVVFFSALCSQVTMAQVSNDSGSPVSNELVGDLSVGQTSPEAVTGIAIENLCPQLAFREGEQQNSQFQSDLLGRCGDLTFDETPQDVSLRLVATEEMATQETEIAELSTGQLNSISARLAGLRNSIQTSVKQVSLTNSQPGVVAFQLNDYGFGAGAGDGIADSGRLGAYINATVGSGSKDQTANESGFDIDATAFTFGMDYRLGQGKFVGAALGLNSSESEMSNNGGNIDSDGTSLMAYGTKALNDNMYIDGTIGIGQYDYDTVRNLNYVASGTPVIQQALGSTEADMTFASFGIGRDSSYKQDQGFLLSYSGRLNYLDADVDGFTERMSNQGASGFGMNMEMDSQQIESLTSVLGIQMAKVVSTSSGVVIPYVGLSYIHEFEDDPRIIRARFANDPFSTGFNQTNGTNVTGTSASSNGQSVPTIIDITTDAPDSDYFRLAFGTSGILPGGKNWFVALDTLIDLAGTSYYSVSAGFRAEF